MIHSFLNKETAKIWGRQFSKKLPPEIQKRALSKLKALSAAVELIDLQAPPSNHLEALQGDWAGFYSIRINDQWRIVFQFNEGQAHQVGIVDYH